MLEGSWQEFERGDLGINGRSEEEGLMQQEQYSDGLRGDRVLLDWAYSCLKTHKWNNPIIVHIKMKDLIFHRFVSYI